MPSLSPGDDAPSAFHTILPGCPTAGLQSFATFTFRWKRYFVYISSPQLNFLCASKPQQAELVQAITFDEEVLAIRAEKSEKGRLAVATRHGIWILVPQTSISNRVTWRKELLLRLSDTVERCRTICWGSEGELLVGSENNISGFNTLPTSKPSTPSEDTEARCERRGPVWSKTVSSSLQFAEFSSDSSYIATAGARDRLVKIWRRLSYEEAIFDYAYLPHDGIVTLVQWRSLDPARLDSGANAESDGKSYHSQDEQCDVLYTISSDANLRIWRTSGHADLDLLSLYAVIDLVSAIPHSPTLPMKDGRAQKPARYAFILSSGSYSLAVNAALRRSQHGQVKHSIEHIKEVRSKDPDIVVALDTQGRMSAWGLSSVAHKRRPGSTNESEAPFHVAHSESIGMAFHHGIPASFETWYDGDLLNIIAHNYGHNISWWQGSVENFSSSSAISTDRGKVLATWTGVQAPISGLHTTHDLKSMISTTASGKIDEWSTATITCTRSLDLHDQVVAVDDVQRGKSLLALTAQQTKLARIVDDKGIVSASHRMQDSQPLKWRRLESTTGADEAYLIYCKNTHYSIVDVNPTRSDWQSMEPIVRIRTAQSSKLPFGSDVEDIDHAFEDVHVLNHPRKAGWLRMVGVHNNGSIYRRDVSSLALANKADIGKEATLVFASGINPGLSTSTSDLLAITSKALDKLVVIDLKQGYAEHDVRLSEPVSQLAFPTSNVDEFALGSHNILAVGYAHKVNLFARARYNNHHDHESQQWTLINSVSIAGIGMTISAINLAQTGRLAIAAGQCLFFAEDQVDVQGLNIDTQQSYEFTKDDDTAAVVELASMFTSPIQCWHTSVLRQLISHNHFDAVLTILCRLEETLRFHAEGDMLDPLLGLDINETLDRPASAAGRDDAFLAQLREQLDEINLPFTSDADQERLKLVVQAVTYTCRYRQSLDDHAVKYLFQWRYQDLHEKHKQQLRTTNEGKSNGFHEDQVARTAPTMHWREIVFAYHSNTQQPLLEILVQHYENKLDWDIVRALGIALWLRTIKAAQSEGSAMASIEQIFESVGQNAYRQSFPPDPVNASLFLVALRKKAVLLTLWRVAVGNKEQKNTQNFLKRNFEVEENRTAARKNAYALMGKRRFEYAAAFFLLANDAPSAIRILAGQCEDIHLAIGVARAYCGDGSAEVAAIMQERVLPKAVAEGDRWLMHFAYDLDGRQAEAGKALVGEFADLVDAKITTPSRWQRDDPTTLSLYRELRDVVDRNGKKRPEMALSVAEEYRAVLRSARVLRRLGFWLLAVRVVSHWKFADPPEQSKEESKIEKTSSSNVALPADIAPAQTKQVKSMLDDFF